MTAQPSFGATLLRYALEAGVDASLFAGAAAGAPPEPPSFAQRVARYARLVQSQQLTRRAEPPAGGELGRVRNPLFRRQAR
jgi:hypothetical protein